MTVRPCSLKAASNRWGGGVCWTRVVRQQIATEYNTIQYITYYSKTFICSHRSQTQVFSNRRTVSSVSGLA